MSLSREEFLKLPIIALNGLESNPPADYSPAQQTLLPYADILQTGWWLCFAAVLAVLILRFFIIPLIKNRGQAHDLSCPPVVTENVPIKGAGAIQTLYHRLFSLHEIEQDVALRLFGGAILIGYLVTYAAWQMDPSTTIDAVKTGQNLCWPFFQSCADWIKLRGLPYGYSQTTIFMGMFGLIMLAAYALLARRILLAHASILALFVFKLYMTLIAFWHNGNYDYYHTLFNIVFLFLPRKRFFGSLILVWCYFLSTATKIHPSWTLAGFFGAMREGLPLTPRSVEPVMTNLVVFMEMVMSWFLFSRRRWLQQSVFTFFCLFHLYSGILVGYHYPTIVMPSLVIFFGPLFRPFPSVPLTRAGLPGWILVAALLACQLFSHLLPGDTKLTMQGNYYGLYMFEANHQCRVTYASDEWRKTKIRDHVNARFRCGAWENMVHAQQKFCRDGENQKIAFTILHSINGGPFYKIVNEPDLCSLHYKAFASNDWIKNETNAEITGRPVQNYYQ
jgi:hypothetical protein